METALVQQNNIPALSIGAFTATPVGLIVSDEDVPFEVWEAYGKALHRVEGAIQWVRGDWLNEGERRYGEKYPQAIQEEWHAEYETLRKYREVAQRIKIGSRLPNLSWAHHLEVAWLEPEEQDCFLALAEENEWTRAQLRNEIRGWKRHEKAGAPSGDLADGILVGSIAEVGDQVPTGSVDLILTDPPYGEDAIHLYGELSQLAARVLKPGALCLVYSGQVFLPRVIEQLGMHLDYAWAFAARHSGGNRRIYKMNVNNGWKPVLAYVKPPLEPWWDSFIDITTGGREKDLHDWQQPEAEAAYFIEHLSLPEGLILDPFAGSGTTLAAAKALGRRHLGIEVDSDSVSIASDRIRQVHDPTEARQ